MKVYPLRSAPPSATPPRPGANMAHTRKSRPDSGLGFQSKALKTFEGVPSSLGSGSAPPSASPPRPGAKPEPRNPKLGSRSLELETQTPKSETQSPKLETPELETRSPQPHDLRPRRLPYSLLGGAPLQRPAIRHPTAPRCKYGTHKKVKAGFRPWLSSESP